MPLPPFAALIDVPPQNVPPPLTITGLGTGFTVMTTVLVAALQGPAPSGSFVVSVSVTVPLAIVGVYVEVNEFTLEKVPLGALHVELVALPPILPASVMVPSAQTDCGKPAFAVAGGLMVTAALPCVPQQVPSSALK